MVSLLVIHSVLFAATILTLDFPQKHHASLAMLLMTGLIVYDAYLIPGSGLSLILSLLAVFSLTLFDLELPRALKEHDFTWFGQQYALASLMASMVYVCAWTQSFGAGKSDDDAGYERLSAQDRPSAKCARWARATC
jgi:hypothetical protein